MRIFINTCAKICIARKTERQRQREREREAEMKRDGESRREKS